MTHVDWVFVFGCILLISIIDNMLRVANNSASVVFVTTQGEVDAVPSNYIHVWTVKVCVCTR